jgi:hypothetical protein
MYFGSSASSSASPEGSNSYDVGTPESPVRRLAVLPLVVELLDLLDLQRGHPLGDRDLREQRPELGVDDVQLVHAEHLVGAGPPSTSSSPAVNASMSTRPTSCALTYAGCSEKPVNDSSMGRSRKE